MAQKTLFWEEISVGMWLALQKLVPLPEDREPMKWNKVPQAFAYFIPYLFLAYLVRRANTRLIRLLLLPVVITSILCCTYRYRVEDRRYCVGEWIRTLIAWHIIGKSLNFGFSTHGRFKVGEKTLPRVNDPNMPPASSSIFPPWLADAIEVSMLVRGIGWDFGRHVHLPQRTRSLNRGPFLIATIFSFIKNFVILDLCESLVKRLPKIGDSEGNSIFVAELPGYARYTLSTAIHIMVGTAIICGLESWNDIIALVKVGLLGRSPTIWYPLFDSPWRCTSLSRFWGKGWHQLLRHTFLSLGGYPGYWLAGKAGMVIGTCFASGIFHIVGLPILNTWIVVFFTLQGVGILLEHVWKNVTGRRVGGVIGWVWIALVILGLGQSCTDVWVSRGMSDAILIPESVSLARRVIFPLFQPYVLARI